MRGQLLTMTGVWSMIMESGGLEPASLASYHAPQA